MARIIAGVMWQVVDQPTAVLAVALVYGMAAAACQRASEPQDAGMAMDGAHDLARDTSVDAAPDAAGDAAPDGGSDGVRACATSADCETFERCGGGRCVTGGRFGGDMCVVGESCLSNNCVSGLCCDVACRSACTTCDGPGTRGTCTPLARGAADARCAPYLCAGPDAGELAWGCPDTCVTDSDCADGTRCTDMACRGLNGAACTSHTDCGSDTCVAGLCCDQRCDSPCARCDLPGSKGTCTAVPVGTVTPGCRTYRCDGNVLACPSSCDSDADCIPGIKCVDGACGPNGSLCTTATVCASGYCTDGVCCDAPCSLACYACNVAGAVGTCSPLPPGEDPGSTCKGEFMCDGKGTCARK